MTLDLTKINRVSLEAVRASHGFDQNDASGDARIAALSPKGFIAAYAAWHIGDPSWGRQFYDLTHEVDAAVLS